MIKIIGTNPQGEKQIRYVSKDLEAYSKIAYLLAEGYKVFKVNFDAKENQAGRPKVTEMEMVQECKNIGKTQEETAKLMNVSLSTIRRNWK